LQEIRALAQGQLLLEQPTPELPRDFLLVDFAEGLGSAAVVNGKVYLGPLALNGELGHTPVVGNHRKCGCGAIGCVETLVNRSGLLQSFGAATGHRNPHWKDLVNAVAHDGVPAWLKEALDHVATSMAAAANIMGLQRVIITGSLTELPPAVVEHLSASVISGCLWKRFGQMICHAGERHRLAGLVATGIDRIVLRSSPLALEWEQERST
jgi:predicted NBD/HSP70 family sugar kinase